MRKLSNKSTIGTHINPYSKARLHFRHNHVESSYLIAKKCNVSLATYELRRILSQQYKWWQMHYAKPSWFIPTPPKNRILPVIPPTPFRQNSWSELLWCSQCLQQILKFFPVQRTMCQVSLLQSGGFLSPTATGKAGVGLGSYLNIKKNNTSSWWFQPIWKICWCSSNMIISPGNGKNKKYLKPPSSTWIHGTSWFTSGDESPEKILWLVFFWKYAIWGILEAEKLTKRWKIDFIGTSKLAACY